MTTQEYKWMYDFALVTKQQLEEVGFKIDLQVMDWSTLGQRRVQPKEYDVFTTGMGNFFDPTHHIYLTPNWPGWTSDEEIADPQRPARARDRPEEALRPLGADDQALLREGAGDRATATSSASAPCAST